MVAGPWPAVAHSTIGFTQQVEALQVLQSNHGLRIMFIAHQELPGLEVLGGGEVSATKSTTENQDPWSHQHLQQD